MPVDSDINKSKYNIHEMRYWWWEWYESLNPWQHEEPLVVEVVVQVTKGCQNFLDFFLWNETDQQLELILRYDLNLNRGL